MLHSQSQPRNGAGWRSAISHAFRLTWGQLFIGTRVLGLHHFYPPAAQSPHQSSRCPRNQSARDSATSLPTRCRASGRERVGSCCRKGSIHAQGNEPESLVQPGRRQSPDCSVLERREPNGSLDRLNCNHFLESHREPCSSSLTQKRGPA